MKTRTRHRIVERREREFRLEEEDVRHLESLDEVTVRRQPCGSVEIEVAQYVGVIGLPSGEALEIQPKAPVNLLFYLAYVGRIDEELAVGKDADVTGGDSLVELIARLYIHELDKVLKRGLHREYRVEESSEKFLRGQLDLQQQLQQRGPGTTRFECRYDELTHGIRLNKVLLDALHRLRPLVSDDRVLADVNRYYGRLRQRVDHERMRRSDIDEISLSRLNDYYREALRLAELIFEQTFVTDIGSHDRQFNSLLINMETVFEEVVYRAVDEVVDSSLYGVRNDNIGHLARKSDGEKLLKMKPDFYIQRQSDGEVVYVGDAKWKVESEPEREDLYQIASYQAKYGTEGMLVYPDINVDLDGSYSFQTGRGSSGGRGPLQFVELSTTGSSEYATFQSEIEQAIQSKLPDKLVN